MNRISYKTALRAKGIRPIPPAHKLRSSIHTPGRTIDATEAAQKERIVGKHPALAAPYSPSDLRCAERGDMYCNHDYTCAAKIYR